MQEDGNPVTGPPIPLARVRFWNWDIRLEVAVLWNLVVAFNVSISEIYAMQKSGLPILDVKNVFNNQLEAPKSQ